MLRMLAFFLLVVLVVVAVLVISAGERKESEARFQATLSESRSALKTGTPRSQVEDYLHQRSMSFETQAQDSTDRVSMGQQPRNLFCQPWKVFLDFEFKPAGPSSKQPNATDVLTGIDLHREGVCF